ncbi:hypothetical protein, partial [Klebsiella quasipneumoniae]|uniref:hypothetical protein n=1 Tax=Klebsiella quasipneumoniae TaxID=1463165 RepID=UPI0027304B0C
EELITDELKKQFIKRFWKKRIGVSTLAEFQNNMDNYFTVECQNLLIQNYILKTLKPNDFIDGGTTNVDNTNQNNSTNSSQGKSDN